MLVPKCWWMAWRAERAKLVECAEVVFFVGVDVVRARENNIGMKSEESVEGVPERKHDEDDGGGSRQGYI